MRFKVKAANLRILAAGMMKVAELHSNLQSFLGGLKALPKGSPLRGTYITRHMSHGPFLDALKAHPQGSQLHAQLTGYLNSPANAGLGAPAKVRVG